MSLLKTIAAFGAGYAACRFIEARAQRVPLDLAFKPENLLKSVKTLAFINDVNASSARATVGPDGQTSIAVTRRLPTSVSDADWSPA